MGGRFEPMAAERRYPHVQAAIFGTPWAIQPEKLAAIAEIVSARIDGFQVSQEFRAAVTQAAERRPTARTDTSIAVIPLRGTLLWRAGEIEQSSGATSLSLWGRTFDQLVADPHIGHIVIDVDSPGGETSGTMETAARVREGASRKPVTAVVNALCASAAYWIASQATELVSTPSGHIGSVGVYAMHIDQSRRDAAQGFTPTYVEAPAGGFKTETSPHRPLSDEATANLQSLVDSIYGQFVADIARGRRTSEGNVRSNFGRGRMFMPEEAKRRGMIDRIETLDATIARVVRGGGNNRAGGNGRAELERIHLS